MHLYKIYCFLNVFLRTMVSQKIAWDSSKHVVLYNKQNLAVFGHIDLIFVLVTTQRADIH